MAFIPSEDLSTVLSKARTGLWFERLYNGRVALVCKIPDKVIKSIYRGARCSFLLSIVEAEALGILCLGFRVEDGPENPITTTMPNLLLQDLLLLKETLASKRTTIHCLNEMNHPTLSAWASLEAVATEEALEKLNHSESYYLESPTLNQYKFSDFHRIITLALDRFQAHIYGPKEAVTSGVIQMTAAIGLELDIWPATKIFDVSPSVSGGPFRIDDEREGRKQEKLIHVAIDYFYPGNTYWSPQERDGNKWKELTDVLAFDSFSFYVIESKAVYVLKGSAEMPSEKQGAAITKKVIEALGQVRRAIRKIRSDREIFDVPRGKPIVVPNKESALAHAIVVLSEMYFLADWQHIASRIAEFSKDRSFYHVVDFLELNYLLSNSEDAASFNTLLLQRWAAVMDSGTAYGRAMVPV